MTQNILKWFNEKILDKELDLDDFDEKLAIQKAVYIAQSMGMDFKYNFGWHVRGVYSSSLTVDMYKVHHSDLHCTPPENFVRVVDQLLSIKNAVGTVPKTLELVSSVIYAKSKRCMDEERTKQFIKSVKPWFSEEDIDKAIEATRQLHIPFQALCVYPE